MFAIYDNNILPMLIMLIIKIMFLYFMEIAHTDDFPSTGTRLVYVKKLKIGLFIPCRVHSTYYVLFELY